MMAIDATFQVTVDKLPLIFAGIISPTEGFLSILAGIQDHLDTDTFKLIFGYLKDNGFPAPTALQADGCKATRKALKEIWPECDLSMCYIQTKKNCKRELGKFSIYQFISFSHQVFKKYKYRFRTKFGNVFEPNLSRFLFSQT